MIDGSIKPDPQGSAVRALAFLAEAEAVFPYGSDEFRRALDSARRAIGHWAIGLVRDIDRRVQS